MGHVLDSFAGFDDFLAYLAVSLVLLALLRRGLRARHAAPRVRAHPRGQPRRAFSLSGAILGFIVPLASAIEYSVGLVDMAIWGAIALVVQVAAFVVVKLLIPTITDDIAAGKQAQGFFLGALSLGVGLLNAACMTY